MEGLSDREEKSGERFTFGKVGQAFSLLCAKNNHALAKLDKFSDLDVQVLNELAEKDIKGLILDVDRTLAPYGGDVLPENIEKIQSLLDQGIKIVFFSNKKYSDRYADLEAMGVIVVRSGEFPKPDSRGFLECCERMGLSPEQVLMVGDDFITDGGSIKAGIDFVHVDPIVVDGERLKIKQRLHGVIKTFLIEYSRELDARTGRRVFRSHEFRKKRFS